jgi:membrane protein implicated in regulation of membrane protease activity
MAEFLGSYAIWIIWIIFGLFFLFFLVTAPCHAVLLLPLVGLPLFWLLPLGYALPINIATWLATPFLYRVIRRAMIRPVEDGFQSLTGTEAEVVSRLAPQHSAQYLVRSRGELWSAYSTDTFQPGEPVNIVAVKGVGVVIERVNNGHDRTGNAKTVIGGTEENERHCH